jgi:predicted CXXCH cytochrome family protein
LKASKIIGLFGIFILLLMGILVLSRGVLAQTEPNQPQATPDQVGVSNEYCLSCHAQPGMETTLPSGEILYLSVNPDTYNQSIHGSQGYACVQCHTDIREFPHPPANTPTLRDVTIQFSESCARCHQDKFDLTMDSVHETALLEGNKNAAVCADCHGAHDVSDPNEPRSKIPQTCERCHSTIYTEYAESIHGSALLNESNPDVPTCIDCHGVHNISGPNNSPFRLYSPDICLKCHGDKELMAKYGISTDIAETYLADFHGKTVLFDQNFPDQQPNTPVCIDCHGVHSMKQVDDAESKVIKSNLLVTCQQCHPDASPNFADAWIGHYPPDRTLSTGLFC